MCPWHETRAGGYEKVDTGGWWGKKIREVWKVGKMGEGGEDDGRGRAGRRVEVRVWEGI